MTGKEILDLRQKLDEFFRKIDELNTFPFAVDFLTISKKEIAEKEEKLKELETQRTLLTSVIALSATTDETKKALTHNVEQINLSESVIKNDISAKKCKMDEYAKIKRFLESETALIAEKFSGFGDFIFEEDEDDATKEITLPSEDKECTDEGGCSDEKSTDSVTDEPTVVEEKPSEVTPESTEKSGGTSTESPEEEKATENDVDATTTLTATEETTADSDSEIENNSGNILDLFTTTLRVLEEHIKEVSGQSENFKSYPAEFETEYEGICSQLSSNEEYVENIIPGFDSWESKVIIYSLPTAFLKSIGRTDVVRARSAADQMYYKGQRNKWRSSLTLTIVEELRKLSGEERKEFITANTDIRTGAVRKLKQKAFCYISLPEKEEEETE